MTTSEIIKTILAAISGLAIFMFGLKTMSDRLEKQASNKVRKMFAKATNNKFMGMSVGAGVTAIIQSSSATTVMVVGLVNAGILSLSQAAAVIMGANIGTTITAVLISLPITSIVAASGLIGVFMVMFSNKSKVKNVGYIIIGLGMIFAGLAVMGDSMKEFTKLDSIRNFFASTSNPILLVVIGTLVTALIQSSSATTGILITLANVGLININAAVFIILGINIGTCITAILAAIGTNVNAQRTAAIHLLFNLTGTLIFALIFAINPIRYGIINSLSRLGSILPNEGIGAQIAAFHIIFNITTTLLLLPFVKQIVNISIHLVPEKKNGVKENQLLYLNDLILESSSIAMANAKKEIMRMIDLAKINLDLAINSVCNNSLDSLEEFTKREMYIDWLNQEIPNYLTKISSLNITYEDEIIIASYYHVISDTERIGDYAENIMDYLERMVKDNITFSEQAIKEMMEMYNAVLKLYNTVIKGFDTIDITLLTEVESIEDSIDEYKVNLSNMHIKRLHDGTCSAPSGALFLSLISNLERIADHMRNIYNSIRKYAKPVKNFNTIIYKNK